MADVAVTTDVTMAMDVAVAMLSSALSSTEGPQTSAERRV